MAVQRIQKPAKCHFCSTDVEVDYKDTNALHYYLSERGKLQGRSRTGLCAKHQRRVSQAVKRARALALIAFAS